MKSTSMKRKSTFGLLAAFLMNILCVNAQDITGQWDGVLSVQGMSMKLVFHISKSDDGYTSTMDSPDQAAYGIRATKTTFESSKLSIEIANIGMLYEGDFKTDSISGIFKQGGMAFPLTLKRGTEKMKTTLRPQEPKPPYPYRSEDVSFENKSAGITLAGTLTMPQSGSNFMAVILISGSGPQNRDEEIMGHKPFLVIADYLTRNGIAVLRYDDRGTAKSSGDFKSATSADFATDAESAINYLKTKKEINPKKIGLIGHSEGGTIAPMIAARSNDVAFIVLLAGTGLRGDAISLLQAEIINRAMGMPEDSLAIILKEQKEFTDVITNSKEMISEQEILKLLAKDVDPVSEAEVYERLKPIASQIATPWSQYFFRYDPAPALEKVKCPVLAVNGNLDVQVPSKENLAAISAALKKGGNKNVTIKEYEGLNHLFQECTTGMLNEYAIIEQTFSPIVLKDLTDWLLKR